MTNLRTGKCFHHLHNNLRIQSPLESCDDDLCPRCFVIHVMDPKFKSSLELWDITRARTYQATVMASNVLVCDPRP